MRRSPPHSCCSRNTSADLVLLETGMGGRDDSTNVVACARRYACITPIGLDHQDVLGATLIGNRRAQGRHPQSAARPPSSRARRRRRWHVDRSAAERVGAPLFRAGRRMGCVRQPRAASSCKPKTRALDLPLPALQGAHQIDNAGLACAALLVTAGFALSDEAFADGVATRAWPARLQPLTRGALSAPIRARGGEVWVDGGHNAHAADSARARAGGYAAQARRRARRYRRPARAQGSASLCRARSRRRATAHRRAACGSARRAEHDRRARARRSASKRTPRAILDAAMQNAAQLPAPRVLICGSFLLAAEALS